MLEVYRMRGLGLAALMALAALAFCQGQSEDPFNTVVPEYSAKNADVQLVLADIFERQKIHVVISLVVQGNVTVELQNVTVEALLQSVLKQVNGTYRVDQGKVSIVPRTYCGPCDFFEEPDPIVKKRNPWQAADAQNLFKLEDGNLVKYDASGQRSLGSVALKRRFKAVNANLNTLAGRENLRRLFEVADSNLFLSPRLKGVVNIPAGPAEAELAMDAIGKSLKLTSEKAAPPHTWLYAVSRYVSEFLVETSPMDDDGHETVLALDSNFVYVGYGRWTYKVRKSDMALVEYSERDAR